MKNLIDCPKCYEPLLNGVIELKSGAEAWKKVCDKKIDHSFIYLTKEGKEDLVLAIGMTLNSNKSLKVFWDFVCRKIIVHKGKSIVDPIYVRSPIIANEVLEIPWFEPNIDEYDKLIDKIKKYVIFS